jgi:hypothetical protein
MNTRIKDDVRQGKGPGHQVGVLGFDGALQGIHGLDDMRIEQ